MLEKLLPLLQLKKLNNPKPEDPIPDNLIDVTEDPRQDSVVKLFKVLIAVFCVVFILIIGTNKYLDYQLQVLKSNQDILYSSLSVYFDTEKTLVDLSKRVAFYKKSTTGKRELNAKTALILSCLPEGITYKSFSIEGQNFKIQASGETMYSITQFIAALFDKKAASEVTLNSAELDSNNHAVTIDIKGVLP